MLGIIFFCGYYQVINEVIEIIFGSGLQLGKSIIIVITVNYYIQFLRKSIMVFKDACGAFYYDRYKPIIEGLLNIVLSLLFVYYFPENIKVVGVIIATIITDLLICNIVEPYVLFKHGLKTSCRRFLIKNYLLDFVFLILLIGTPKLGINNNVISFFVNGSISLFVSLIVCYVYIISNKKRKEEFWGILNKIKLKIKKVNKV